MSLEWLQKEEGCQKEKKDDIGWYKVLEERSYNLADRFEKWTKIRETKSDGYKISMQRLLHMASSL